MQLNENQKSGASGELSRGSGLHDDPSLFLHVYQT